MSDAIPDDAHNLQLMKAAATEKALKEKLNEYNLQLINLWVEKDYTIDKL